MAKQARDIKHASSQGNMNIPRNSLTFAATWSNQVSKRWALFNALLACASVLFAPTILHPATGDTWVDPSTGFRVRDMGPPEWAKAQGSNPPPVEYERHVETRAEREEREWNQLQQRQQSEEAARVAAQEAHFESLKTEASFAFDRKDDREGLRLLRALKDAYLEAGITDPKLNDTIKRTDAILDWRKSNTAAEFRIAMNKFPSAFSESNKDFILKLEKLEQYTAKRPAQEAQEQANAQHLRALVENLATTADQPGDRDVLGPGTAQGAAAGMDTRKSDPTTSANPSESAEHASYLSGLGFDSPGKLYIKKAPATVPLLSTSQITEEERKDPQIAAGISVINELQHKRIELDVQRIALTKQRNASKQPAEMEALSNQLQEKNQVYNVILRDLAAKTAEIKKQAENLDQDTSKQTKDVLTKDFPAATSLDEAPKH